MSLSVDPVFSLLKSDFICGVRNIADQPYCGTSGKHAVGNPAVKTTNGAGPHNIQLFVLASDGTVLHCLPGYWAPQDLAHELKFAEKLNKLWLDSSLAREEKDDLFKSTQLAHIREHSSSMANRSRMQGFDMKFELKKRPDTTDTVLREDSIQPVHRTHSQKPARAEAGSKPVFKTTDQVVHERMAERPFVSYQEFDVADFSDYGRPKYDKKPDGGEGVFRSSQRMSRTRRL
ncbi:MAG: hypothetical protein O3B01_26790 [Planctomycetota bacterium]|nr:hypothetical protein [Planctomycetota bacterium]MDA1142185.1 hypothetical protein [Planctomycetota bacterium]